MKTALSIAGSDSCGGYVACVSLADGSLVWSHEGTDAGYYWTGAVPTSAGVLTANDAGRVSLLDAATGQNAVNQAREFSNVANITGIILTKLDGTAKGGVVIGISDQFKIPVKYIGLGEGIEDMQVFRKKEFVDSLFGETEK